MFTDVATGTRSDRPGLAELLDHARPGDRLCVIRLDRLGRSLRELLETVDGVKAQGIHLVSLEERLDTSSAAGELVFHVFGAIAHFERRLISERTRDGIGAAIRSSSCCDDQRSSESGPSQPSLHVARGHCMVNETRWERGVMPRWPMPPQLNARPVGAAGPRPDPRGGGRGDAGRVHRQVAGGRTQGTLRGARTLHQPCSLVGPRSGGWASRWVGYRSVGVSFARPFSLSPCEGLLKVRYVRTIVLVCLALSLAACGGGHLSVDLPGGETRELPFSPGQAVEHPLPFRISGGIPPYESSIEGCPDWVTLFPDQGVLAGMAPVEDRGKTYFCTYRVTESDPGFRPARTVSYGLRLVVGSDVTELKLTQAVPGNELTLKIGRRSQTIFQMASGGVAPYTYELLDCTLPVGLEFHPSTRILSGTPNAEYRGPNCTYRVTDSSSPPASVSLSFVLVVEPLEASDWRFRTRTVEPGQGLCVIPGSGWIGVATLPAAHAGERAASYALPGAPAPPESGSFLSFDPSNRVLTYTNPEPPPVLGTPNTYRYLVGTADSGVNATADDALCLDVQYNGGGGICPEVNGYLPEHHVHIRLEVRDDAFWDENAEEYRCPDTTAPRPGAQGSPSNPVHEALGPVHARRASAVAHAAVRDRVREWSPGAEQASFAIAPEVGLASLSGQSEGFDYSGTSESASFGAETGAGAWQAGLVASVTNTELHYRAEAVLAAQGYRTGEHDTEILSLHPFAAWHAPSGGHFWASTGAGAGSLSHRDDLGFRSWSRSDVRLFAYAVGASVPVADVLSGELQAEAGIESFAFDIKGGGRISSSLPTFRGRDYRAGLAWSASVTGAPSLSVAYKHLTGDGPEGGQLEARGSVSVAGIFDPRLTVIGNAEGSFGLGDYEHDSWGLGGGVRFAPGDGNRGFGLDLDTRLVSLDDRGSSDVGIRGEAGYGLWGGPFFGTVRPYVGLIRHSSNGSLRRALGVDLRDTPDSRIKVEVYDELRDQFRALRFTLRHRF